MTLAERIMVQHEVIMRLAHEAEGRAAAEVADPLRDAMHSLVQAAKAVR